MDNPKKVTVLKRMEDGKVKSLLIFNSANEQARLYFSDDEKLTRMVVGNGAENLVAFDRVGSKFVTDPLKLGYIERVSKNKDKAYWSYTQNGDGTEFWLDIKAPSGQWGECVDSQTGKPTGSSRCCVNAWETGVRFQNAAGYSAVQIQLSPQGVFQGIKDNLYGECEVIEQNTTTHASEEQSVKSLMQKEFERHFSR